MPPGAAILTRLTVQFSNCRFVIHIPLIIAAIIVVIIVVIVITGSGCATIAIIEVAAVQWTRGAVRFVIIIAIAAANAAYIA